MLRGGLALLIGGPRVTKAQMIEAGLSPIDADYVSLSRWMLTREIRQQVAVGGIRSN